MGRCTVYIKNDEIHDFNKAISSEGDFIKNYGCFLGEKKKVNFSKMDVSKVTNMQAMFYETETFNEPIGHWNVSKVTDMTSMFQLAQSFNQPIGNWNVSNVTNMTEMFSEAYAFNQPIGNWNVSKVTTMYGMFYEAKSFNQPIDNWDVSKVNDIDMIGFDKPLKPLIAYSVYQWFLKDKITRQTAEKIFGSAVKLKKYEQKHKRDAFHGSLPSSRSSSSVKTSLPRSIVHDVIELEEKPISAYKYSPKEDNFPILFADKNDYKVIRSLDLEKVLEDTNNIMYECKPSTLNTLIAINRDQVRPTAYLQTSVLGIQLASVGVVDRIIVHSKND
jgi:surface protein